MKNEAKLESAAEFREAIGVLAAASEDQRAQIVALGELIKAMDVRIQLQQRLIDGNRDVLIKHGLAKGRSVEKMSQAN